MRFVDVGIQEEASNYSQVPMGLTEQQSHGLLRWLPPTRTLPVKPKTITHAAVPVFFLLPT
jgi:hypothetical protein